MMNNDHSPLAATLTDEQRQTLVETARTYARRAYAPYSGYQVGAALLAADGTIYGGCNVENASFTVGTCAERCALFKAVSEGAHQFIAVAVVTRDGGSPCGACRQMLYEFSPQMRVILADETGTIHHDLPLTDLLPLGFNRASLSPDRE
jgi:cytidine deaminase